MMSSDMRQPASLATPLAPPQIEAACRLHARLEQWRLSDASLLRLRKRMPEFDLEACVAKVVAVNALYGTQVYAVLRMARHAHEVLNTTDLTTAGSDLVERLARLPVEGQERSRMFTSFAAKFCHFFIDEERFPIFDEAARNVLRLHLGREQITDGHQPYRAFCTNHERLRELAALHCSGREFDRYLWLTGMYMKWLKERVKPTPRINAELRRLLAEPSAEVARDLDTMLPPTVQRAFDRVS